jgi:ornithine cyclodeaminase
LRAPDFAFKIKAFWAHCAAIIFSNWSFIASIDEIQQLAPDHPVTELWQVMTGKAQGRRDAKQITLFDSVGFAIEDFSALRYVFDRAKAAGLYQELDLLADPDEPHDLYEMLVRAKG